MPTGAPGMNLDYQLNRFIHTRKPLERNRQNYFLIFKRLPDLIQEIIAYLENICKVLVRGVLSMHGVL